MALVLALAYSDKASMRAMWGGEDCPVKARLVRGERQDFQQLLVVLFMLSIHSSIIKKVLLQLNQLFGLVQLN